MWVCVCVGGYALHLRICLPTYTVLNECVVKSLSEQMSATARSCPSCSRRLLHSTAARIKVIIHLRRRSQPRSPATTTANTTTRALQRRRNIQHLLYTCWNIFFKNVWKSTQGVFCLCFLVIQFLRFKNHFQRVCGRWIYKATLLHFYVKRAHSGAPGQKSIWYFPSETKFWHVDFKFLYGLWRFPQKCYFI